MNRAGWVGTARHLSKQPAWLPRRSYTSRKAGPTMPGESSAGFVVVAFSTFRVPQHNNLPGGKDGNWNR
jgi:hypothetical protein